MKDPYVNPSNVLTNKLGIDDYDLLNQAEADIGFVKLINVDGVDVDYFDEEMLKKLHKHIFEDIFEWAGEYRTVPLIKEEFVIPGVSLPYTRYQDISRELHSKLIEFNSIAWHKLPPEELAYTFARKLALIWLIHPFRDGNTRTILSFAYIYAKEHGFPFDMKVFTDNLSRKYEGEKLVDLNVRDKFVLASLDEENMPDVSLLAEVFEKAMDSYCKEESIRSK